MSSTSLQTSRDSSTPPGPRSYLMLSHAFAYARDPLSYIVRARNEYGGLVRMPIPGFTPLLVTDPELIEHVLVTDNKSYVKDIFTQRFSREVAGQGLLTSNGDFWRRQRRLSQPAFHRERITQYAAMMTAAGEEYVATLKPGQVRDLQEDMMHLTLQIVCRALFNTEIGNVVPDVHQIGLYLKAITDRIASGAMMMLPFLTKLPLPINRRFENAVRQLDRAIQAVVTERRKAKVDRQDLLGMLLAAQDEDGSVMTDQQLRDEVLTLFIAGHETTSLAMTYTFMLLSRNPKAAATLSAELHKVLGGRTPTFDDLQSLPYTEAVVLESMRLYPPAWSIGREATRDTELGGYPVRKGTQVWIAPYVMHRNPKFFPDPESFQPERWMDGLQKRLPRFAYAPFGGGPRLCIGSAFAMTETTLLVATIASRFMLRVPEHPPLKLMPSITLRSRYGLHAHVEAAPSPG